MRGVWVIAIAALAGCGNGVSVSSDVKLENATAHLMTSGTCPTAGGALAPCASYQLTFALQNDAQKAIDRVEDVQLSTGGAPLQNGSAIGCAGSPWTLPPGGASGVVDVVVSFGPEASLSVECNDDSVARATAALVSAPSAPGDSFDVKIEGLLSDAQPFMATAHAPIF
ncbi:MAG TPA: hypothetical protein VN947_33355 [Polyangia bacterium]|nr:hypothetical protein [Polyangia bacterium]